MGARKNPSPNGGNGERDVRGRFANGNAGGPGNRYAKQVARLRQMILEAVTDADLRAIVSSLLKRAKDGDVTAAREVLNRLVGKPCVAVDPEQRELEARRLDIAEERLELEEARDMERSTIRIG